MRKKCERHEWNCFRELSSLINDKLTTYLADLSLRSCLNVDDHQTITIFEFADSVVRIILWYSSQLKAKMLVGEIHCTPRTAWVHRTNSALAIECKMSKTWGWGSLGTWEPVSSRGKFPKRWEFRFPMEKVTRWDCWWEKWCFRLILWCRNEASKIPWSNPTWIWRWFTVSSYVVPSELSVTIWCWRWGPLANATVVTPFFLGCLAKRTLSDTPFKLNRNSPSFFHHAERLTS